jgi:hypothetical protein
MGDLQAALDQQFLDITIGKGISKYQRTAQTMTSGVKCRHLKIAGRWGLAMIGQA